MASGSQEEREVSFLLAEAAFSLMPRNLVLEPWDHQFS